MECGESNVDVTLVSGDLARDVAGWSVHDCVESDHRLIEYRLWDNVPRCAEGQLTLVRFACALCAHQQLRKPLGSLV